MPAHGIDRGTATRPRASAARTAARRTAALGLALAASVAAAVPSASLAASTSKTVNYTVKVKQGVLVDGSTVKAKATVVAPQKKVSSWWKAATVSSVVRTGVNGRYQRPYSAQGYRCTPVDQGATSKFTCILRGADVPTTITLRFTAKYRG